MKRIITAALCALCLLAATGCSKEKPENPTRDMNMSVHHQTTIKYLPGDVNMQNPIECMLVRTEEDPDEWTTLPLGGVEGFIYERGHEYELRVRRTMIANPPMDGPDRTYTLISILQDRLVTEPEEPEEPVIETEEDIEYQEMCPFEKYAIAGEFTVDDRGNICYGDGSPLPSYGNARIWLEDVLDKGDPDWVKFQSVPYMAIYSYVISPLTDRIRLVRNESGPMFREVVPEQEFSFITEEMSAGEELRYALILANIYKKGLQKVEFTIRKL